MKKSLYVLFTALISFTSIPAFAAAMLLLGTYHGTLTTINGDPVELSFGLVDFPEQGLTNVITGCQFDLCSGMVEENVGRGAYGEEVRYLKDLSAPMERELKNDPHQFKYKETFFGFEDKGDGIREFKPFFTVYVEGPFDTQRIYVETAAGESLWMFK